MKRRMTVIIAAAGLVLGLAGCGTGSGSDETTASGDTAATTATTEATDVAEPSGDSSADSGQDANCPDGVIGTLSVWVDETRYAALTPIAEKFLAEQCVQVDLLQKNFDDLRRDFASQVAAGEGPDITVGANDWMGEFKTNGLIKPIDLSSVADQLAPSAVAAYSEGGQVYGVPYAFENIGLVRNNALQAETTATTFDELIELAKAVNTKYSVLLQIGTTGDGWHMYPIQSSFGANVFERDANGDYTDKLAMGGEAGHQFAEYLAKLGRDGVFSSSIDGDVATNGFINGEAPYIITGPWNTTKFTEEGMDITVLPIPSAGGQPSAPFVSVPGFYLSANSTNPLLAQAFLVDYLTQKDVQLELFKVGGRPPANLAAQADPLVTEDPIVSGFAAAGINGVIQPAIPAMGAVWEPWGITESGLVAGTFDDPAAAWDEMIANIEKAIGTN